MRLHRFFIDTPIKENRLEIKDERLLHQWRNVFRYGEGSEVLLFDGSGFEYEATVESLESKKAQVKIVSKKEGIMPKQKITLYQSIVKKDKMEWIAEKATELGVSKIVPIISERSEKKDLNLDRIRKIMIEASEQCGRSDVSEIGQMMNFESGIKNYAGKGIAFDPSGSALRNSSFTNHDSLSLFIGPEGGWSEEEVERFKEAKIEIFSLGKLTLRAETAAVTALVVSKLLD